VVTGPTSKGEIMQWYLKVLSHYADFRGRARRTEYWMFTLVNTAVSIVLILIDTLIGTTYQGLGLLQLLYSLGLLVPALAVGVRRLHDTGCSGWWTLLALIPIVGSIVLLVWFATAGRPGPNSYGPDPKAPVDGAWVGGHAAGY
jgi:uncharacterized membrane protein YhaH (DUF805 family)